MVVNQQLIFVQHYLMLNVLKHRWNKLAKSNKRIQEIDKQVKYILFHRVFYEN
jgi:hypothetical protein